MAERPTRPRKVTTVGDVSEAQRNATLLLLNSTTAAGRAAVAAMARAHADDRRLVMPLFANSGFVPFLRNLLCSVERLGVTNWFAVGLDNRTCSTLGAQGEGRCVHPYQRPSMSGERLTYGSAAFFQIALQRPLWVRYLLGRGFEVLNCDTDIVWLSNPLPLLAVLRGVLLVQTDSGQGKNSGFYLARPSPTTQEFFAEWILKVSQGKNEQHALNSVAKHIRIYSRDLNASLFPNGRFWWTFGRGDKRTAFIVHCNWVRDGKKTRLVRDNLWFLEPDGQRCAAGFDPFAGGCDRNCIPVQYCNPSGPCSWYTDCSTLAHWHPMARAAANCSTAEAARLERIRRVNG